MKTVVILGANDLGLSVSDLLNPKEMKLIGIGDTHEESWNVFSNIETGELKDEVEGMPVMPIDLAVSLNPDIIVIASTDPNESHALQYMAIRAGFLNDILFIRDLHNQFSIKGSVIRRITDRIQTLGIEGAVAELGCYQGDTSWQLNVLMPDRKLYLFDTFCGFDSRDLAKERELGIIDANVPDFSNVDTKKLIDRMPYADHVILKEGWFPETAFDIEDVKFALVYMDANLYNPTFSGLEFFFPRMSQGGVIILSNTLNSKFAGVAKALNDVEKKYGAFLIVPIGDLTGTVMIVHP